jgi:hypothetical protein
MVEGKFIGLRITNRITDLLFQLHLPRTVLAPSESYSGILWYISNLNYLSVPGRIEDRLSRLPDHPSCQ